MQSIQNRGDFADFADIGESKRWLSSNMNKDQEMVHHRAHRGGTEENEKIFFHAKNKRFSPRSTQRTRRRTEKEMAR